MPTVDEDLDTAKAALRRIAGIDPITFHPEPGKTPGIVAALNAAKIEARSALDKLFISEYDRSSIELEQELGAAA